MDNTLKLKQEAEEKAKRAKEAAEEREKENKRRHKEMMEHVENRPLLIMQVSMNNAEKLAKMEALKKIRETMKENGVKSTKEFFSPEDLDLLRKADLINKAK